MTPTQKHITAAAIVVGVYTFAAICWYLSGAELVRSERLCVTFVFITFCAVMAALYPYMCIGETR